MALDPLTAGIDLAKTVVQTIWPDKTEQEKAELAGAISLVNGQLAINRAEAESGSLFVGGWRPFIGWVCGVACAWNWIGIALVKAVLAFVLMSGVVHISADQLVQINVTLTPLSLGEMWPVLMGMLGLGGLRTFEKAKNVARS